MLAGREARLKNLLGLSYLGSLGSFGVATCCFLPTALMLLGITGSWVVVFARIAAVGYYVLAASAVVLALAWIVAYRRGVLRRLAPRLTASTVLIAVAGVILLNEVRINDYFISLM